MMLMYACSTKAPPGGKDENIPPEKGMLNSDPRDAIQIVSYIFTLDAAL